MINYLLSEEICDLWQVIKGHRNANCKIQIEGFVEGHAEDGEAVKIYLEIS